MRIIVDQSGYELLNVGDIAMLQTCVSRLFKQWPHAEIGVICNAPERLGEFCTGATAVARKSRSMLTRALPGRYQILGRNASTYLVPIGGGPRGSWSQDEISAVRSADVVVAAGGGYLTDSWLTHATGVLGLLSLAQRLGKPTAMFGQQLGPISRPALRVQVHAVLPRLNVLGLREGTLGHPLARSLGAPADGTIVTGDDALDLIDGAEPRPGQFLGVNMRVCSYSGVDRATAAPIGKLLVTLASEFAAPIMALPVGKNEADLDAIASMLGPGIPGTDISLAELNTPESLAHACGQCRVVVTGSYHAAVFALGQGVPAVCLSKSSYYDAKFAGLLGLFPRACIVLSLTEPDLEARLRKAVAAAWSLPSEDKAAARESAARQCELSRRAYQQFFDSL